LAPNDSSNYSIYREAKDGEAKNLVVSPSPSLLRRKKSDKEGEPRLPRVLPNFLIS
jgi:hypothetical protein